MGDSAPDIAKTLDRAGKLNKLTGKELAKVRVLLDAIKANQGVRRIKFAQQHRLPSAKSKVLRQRLMQK